MKTLLIDGNNAIWRLAKILPVLNAPTGAPVQVIYGFFRLLRAAVEDFEPSHAFVFWDKGAPRLVTEIEPSYKRDRLEKRKHHTAEEEREYKMVMNQLTSIRKTLPMLCVDQMGVPGIEADHLISVACRALEGKKVILSADQDMLQLVDADVSVCRPMAHVHGGPEYYTLENFHKKVGLSPRQFLEMRALIGDRSDGIAGAAKGFGEKSAREVLERYGTLNAIFHTKALKKIANRGNRYALLSEDGVKEKVEQNLRIMDLRRVRSDAANSRIRSMAEQSKKLKKLDLRAYFHEQAFASLLEDFSKWVSPFEMLQSGWER